MEQYSGAEAFLEILNANGVEEVFFNPGGDICPVQVAVLNYRALGKRAPRLVMCLHESVAMTAAHGHYMVSGRPQVVMVHSELGTLQVAGALHNAQWGRTPIVLLAGVQGGPKRVTWKDEPFDQASMARNFVKWDHNIGADEDIHEVLQHAFDVATSEPPGPVYLTYGRETMAKKIEKRSPESYRRPLTMLSPADRASLDQIAEALLSARNPLIVAGYTARHRENVPALIALAEAAAVPVTPGLTWMNFPTTHPLCAGMEEMGGGSRGNRALSEADVVVVIDYDMPYVPADGQPRKDTRVLQIDTDPLTVGRPLWGRGADLFVRADSREAIPALTRVVKGKLAAGNKKELDARARELAARHDRRRAERVANGRSKANELPISPDWVCRCVDDAIDQDTILVNHLISQSSSAAAQIERSKPNTLLACAGGSIMWAPGAALGAKVAAPDKTVVALMTDGGFVWGCPVATLWSATYHRAPFLSVIFDNQSYGAIRTVVERMSESELTDEMGGFIGVDISPPPDYALVAQACGGWGRRVDDPADVLHALREGLKAVRSGQVAVLDVRLRKG